MSVKSFEKKVLARPGAKARVADLEHKILVAQGLVAARKKAELSGVLRQVRVGVGT